MGTNQNILLSVVVRGLSVGTNQFILKATNRRRRGQVLLLQNGRWATKYFSNAKGGGGRENRRL